MELRVVLDGTDYNAETVNIEAVSEALRWDASLQMFTRTYDSELIFQSDAYNYLYGLFVSGDICRLVSVEIFNTIEGQGTFKMLDGNIFVSDCEFNETRRFVTTKVADAGFSSRIQNNRQIDVTCNSTVSKNDIAIAPATPSTITCFNPQDGSTVSVDRVGYSIDSVFAFIVKYITDDTVAYKSDYFETGTGEVYTLISGQALRMGGGGMPPAISFQDLFDTTRKLHNVGMGFDTAPDGRPRVRIEPIAFFRDTAVGCQVQAANEIELSFVKEVLYAGVQVGTTLTTLNDCDEGNTPCSTSQFIDFVGCSEEKYGLTGECNIDSLLNLQPINRVRYDTNTIQDVLMFDNDSYDKDVFIIELGAGTAIAADTDPLGVGQHWYNGGIMNDKVLARYSDYLLGTLGLFSVVNGNGLFYAEDIITSPLLPVQLPVFTNLIVDPTVVVFNPQNAWSNVTNRFTCQYEGVYFFRCGAGIVDWPASPIGNTISTFLNVEHYDSGGTLITKYSGPNEFYITGDPGEMYDFTTPSIPMSTGDYCIFTIDYAQSLPTGINQAEIVYGATGFGPTVKYGYFEMYSSVSVVQNLQVNTGAKLAYVKRAFALPIDDASYDLIRDGMFKAIQVTSIDGTKTGWIQSVRRNFATEQTDFEIITPP